MRLRYTSRALAQLETQYEYLAVRSVDGAYNVIASLRATILRLTVMPHLGRRTDQLGVFVFVEPEYGYRVFYCIDEQTVTVIRILHRKQQ